MKLVLKSVVAFCGVMLVVRSAAAQAPRVFWESTPISAAAIVDDPILANYQTFDLKVELLGSFFSFGQLWMTLPTGSIYNNPFGGNIPPSPVATALFPALEFDTYVSVPPPAVCLARDALAVTGFPILSGTTVDVSMFADTNPGPLQPRFGTFLIGRFTVPIGVTPIVDPNSRVLVHPLTFSSPIPPIPEPAGALAVGALVMLGRTRNRAAEK